MDAKQLRQRPLQLLQRSLKLRQQLRQRALHLRQLANQISDDRARAVAIELASEYDEKADTIGRGETPDGGRTAAGYTSRPDRGGGT